MTPGFREFAKIPRLSRECTITEKIDGTNACVYISDDGSEMRFGSRTRWITPDDDNFGFAAWAFDHRYDLALLGPGTHYGEWWGKGIQRNYGLDHRCFSLFNTFRWLDADGNSIAPSCCHVVPMLARGEFSSIMVESILLGLQESGSQAAFGFMKPEGVVIYHEAAKQYFKKTIERDEEPKTKVWQVKLADEPQIMWTGGRRHGATPGYMGLERRIPR